MTSAWGRNLPPSICMLVFVVMRFWLRPGWPLVMASISGGWLLQSSTTGILAEIKKINCVMRDFTSSTNIFLQKISLSSGNVSFEKSVLNTIACIWEWEKEWMKENAIQGRKDIPHGNKGDWNRVFRWYSGGEGYAETSKILRFWMETLKLWLWGIKPYFKHWFKDEWASALILILFYFLFNFKLSFDKTCNSWQVVTTWNELLI